MVLNSTEVERPNGVENRVVTHEATNTVGEFDIQTHESDFLLWEQELQKLPVFKAEDLPYEGELVDKTRSMIARAVLGSSVEVESINSQQMHLKEAAQRASADRSAREMVKANAKTDYLERTYKSGHTVSVLLKAENGVLAQHGQSMSSVNANSLRYLSDETLRSRARIETHNAHRQQKYFESGLLKDHTMVTFSLVPQRIDAEHAKKLGFFTENMSLAIQAVGNATEDTVELESAFVAGADNQDSRFDIDVVTQLFAELGVDIADKDTEELLANPILIHNSLMQDGVVDIIAMYDKIAGEKTGVDRFYGRIKKIHENYQDHKKECARREAIADEVAERTTRKLIVEASTFRAPTDATRRLHELNDAELKELIISDRSIDTNVLGSVAVRAIEEARMFYANKDIMNLQLSVEFIRRNGVSNSCPNGGNMSAESSVVGIESVDGYSTENKEENGGKKEMTCPFCEEKTVGDPCSDCITCTKCNASTKYSFDENKRRAQQYKKLKDVKEMSKAAVDKKFHSIVGGGR